MLQTPGVAILATQLAATDRRSLSQAWYDALHVVTHDTRSAAEIAPHRDARTRTARNAVVSSRAERGRAGEMVTRAARAPGERQARGVAPDRRAPKSELARRIERVLARSRTQTIPSSFAIHAADGRVQILVRGDGERTRIVALCAPTLRERVDRALAQARFALAGRGVRSEIL